MAQSCTILSEAGLFIAPHPERNPEFTQATNVPNLFCTQGIEFSLDGRYNRKRDNLFYHSLEYVLKGGGGDSFAPNLYIENAIGEPPAKVSTYQEQDSTGATFNVESRRLRGSFAKPMDLKNFPFDVQVYSYL
jgi:hypothetical protein